MGTQLENVRSRVNLSSLDVIRLLLFVFHFSFDVSVPALANSNACLISTFWPKGLHPSKLRLYAYVFFVAVANRTKQTFAIENSTVASAALRTFVVLIELLPALTNNAVMDIKGLQYGLSCKFKWDRSTRFRCGVSISC